MTPETSKALKKLDNLPSALNFVRFVSDDPLQIGRDMARFAMNVPKVNYVTGNKAIKGNVELGIDLATASAVATRSGTPLSRASNLSFVQAYFKFDESRLRQTRFLVDPGVSRFLISRELYVPVRPTTVIHVAGRFCPVFTSGWTSIPFSLHQRRLYMTILEDSFFSLTDYQNSPAELLFYPIQKVQGEKVRMPSHWARGDYELLSQPELDNCIEVFVKGREIARRLILDEAELAKSEDKDSASERQDRPENPDQGSLF